MTVYFKQIRLIPTLFLLDVYVTTKTDKLNELFKECYGLTDDYLFQDPLTPNSVMTIYSSKDSKLKGQKRFILLLESLKKMPVVVHELNHIKWHLAKETNLEIVDDSQEWQSYFMEYLTEKVLGKDYEKVSL